MVECTKALQFVLPEMYTAVWDVDAAFYAALFIARKTYVVRYSVNVSVLLLQEFTYH